MNQKTEPWRFLLEKLSGLSKTAIALYEGGQFTFVGDGCTGNPIEENIEFCDSMCRKADCQEYPVIFPDEHQVAFAAVRCEKLYCLIGPMNMSRKNTIT